MRGDARQMSWTPIRSETCIYMIDCLYTSVHSWVLDIGCGDHICNQLQGFRQSRQLGSGDSNLRGAEGSIVDAEAIGTYELKFPSRLILLLNNCYYVPKLIKNIISYDCLIDQGFHYIFNKKNNLAHKNNVFYFETKNC